MGGARNYDGQLLTALCEVAGRQGSRGWDVELSTLELEKSDVLYIDVNKCISCIMHRCLTRLDIVQFDLRSAESLQYHAPTEPLATS